MSAETFDTTVQLAPAKLTVHLDVTGLRSDGYHLIDAEMVSVDLCDQLTFARGEGVEIIGPERVGVPVDTSNLVARALQAAGCSAHVVLEKRIPHGGGLGGGSSDAAAALRWAGVTDLAVAARIGADVPFCLVGGRAHVSGVGEVVTPLPFDRRDYTLLVPPFGVNTAQVYAAYDELGPGDASSNNHLEHAALVVAPHLRLWRNRLAEWTGRTPMLAGSGATWFTTGHHQKPSTEELGQARWYQVVTTPSHGPTVWTPEYRLGPPERG